MESTQFSGKNFYEVLGVDPDATQNEIKKMYQALVLKYHPDKYDVANITCTSDEAKDYFYLIDKAWKTLNDPKSRIEYDEMLRDEKLDQDFPVNAEVKLSEMEFDEEYEHYTWPCRCSGSYEFTNENLYKEENIICCTTCSLTIRVLHNSQQQE
ncbi:dnaJ homolog subfamily C member 24-like [Dendronephthya gigantea]|uniref:dnaJ homolog subfamily C member 24-like n=1 Tax=Dendronephthya gigantea TaxID=151771 RepID=UPI001069C05A|nr:dnaJ homolog subfamily C member 24-like [Dendronephthya gigantea]